MRSYFIPGQGYVNETGARAYFVPGWGYVNETSGTVTLTLANWLPAFPDKIKFVYKKYFQDVFNIFIAQVVTPNQWSVFPDKQNITSGKQKDINYFDIDLPPIIAETLSWLPIYRDLSIKSISRNTGSSYFLFPVVKPPPTPGSQTYFHKKRGQPGTIIRGAGPQGGNSLQPS